VKGRGDRLLSQRQVGVSKSVEDHLGLRNHSGRERVGNVGEVVLVPCGLSRVESLIRAEADGAVGIRALFEDSANVDLGLVAQVVVEATYSLPITDGNTGAEVRGPGGANFAKGREISRQASEWTGRCQSKACERLGHRVNGTVYRGD